MGAPPARLGRPRLSDVVLPPTRGDETKTEALQADSAPAPALTDAVIKEGLRSGVGMGEVGSMIGVIGMFAALMLAAMTLQIWPLLLFLLAAAFAAIDEANRRQAIKVLRKAGYEVDGEQAKPVP